MFKSAHRRAGEHFATLEQLIGAFLQVAKTCDDNMRLRLKMIIRELTESAVADIDTDEIGYVQTTNFGESLTDCPGAIIVSPTAITAMSEVVDYFRAQSSLFGELAARATAIKEQCDKMAAIANGPVESLAAMSSHQVSVKGLTERFDNEDIHVDDIVSYTFTFSDNAGSAEITVSLLGPGSYPRDMDETRSLRVQVVRDSITRAPIIIYVTKRGENGDPAELVCCVALTYCEDGMDAIGYMYGQVAKNKRGMMLNDAYFVLTKGSQPCHERCRHVAYSNSDLRPEFTARAPCEPSGFAARAPCEPSWFAARAPSFAPLTPPPAV